jgi:hypothetical protein
VSAGLLSGIVLAGYGVGSIAVNQLVVAFINPHNLPPSEHIG